MLKILICLLSGAALAVCVLQLRQQHLELGYQNADLHSQIRSHQSRLWDQQLQIATMTAPNAIANIVGSHNLDMVPSQTATTRPAATQPSSPARRSRTPR